jgi:hypothetical protein
MAHKQYTGPLPTIADSKRLGMTGFRVYCSGLRCDHENCVEFDALNLPDEIIFTQTDSVVRELLGAAGLVK